jgi:hypothetical protein
VSFAAITLCVASQRVFIVVYFVKDSVRKLLVTHSYLSPTSFIKCNDLGLNEGLRQYKRLSYDKTGT